MNFDAPLLLPNGPDQLLLLALAQHVSLALKIRLLLVDCLHVCAVDLVLEFFLAPDQLLEPLRLPERQLALLPELLQLV